MDTILVFKKNNSATIELTIEEAKKLYADLHELFGKKESPIPHIPNYFYSIPPSICNEIEQAMLNLGTEKG